MRLDKFLKVSRIIKRRTVANDVCSLGRVEVNGRLAKPSVRLKVGDVVTIVFGNGNVRFKVLKLEETVKKENASEMYEILEDIE
ncbi:MAG: RNA-binding S4 domain-containing protein [Clostridiales bacterium]|nr:RNA-binding S4 domain-containing protein [Clostridiales bacterium]